MPDGTSTTGGLVYLSGRGNGVYRIPGGIGGGACDAGRWFETALRGYVDGYGGTARGFLLMAR